MENNDLTTSRPDSQESGRNIVKLSLQQALEQAMKQQRSGQLEAAEEIYRKILQRKPDQSDVIHLLGTVYLQRKKPETALKLIQQAIGLKKDSPAYFGSLGLAYRGLKKYDDADKALRHALKLDPHYIIAARNLAVVLSEQGKKNEAILELEKMVQLQPGDAELLRNLAKLYFSSSKFSKSLEIYERLLKIQPNDIDGLNVVGVVLKDTGHLEKAKQVLKKCIAAHPEHPDAYTNLGGVLIQSGDFVGAIACLRKGMEYAPDSPLAHNNLGVALKKNGEYPEAKKYLLRSLELEPNNIAAHTNLGDVLNHLGFYKEAALHLQKAIEIDPACSEALNNLGVTFKDTERHSEALELFKQSLKENPRYLPAWNNMGNIFVARGEVEEGKKCFLKALEIDPDCVPAYYALASTGKYVFTPEQAVRVEALLGKQNLTLEERGLLHFALAQFLDKAGSPEKAFEHARQANGFKKQLNAKEGVTFNSDSHVQAVDRILELFTPELFDRLKDAGVEDDLPVFIMGMPRSGTTLVEQILSSHPKMHGAGELEDIKVIVHKLAEKTKKLYPDFVGEISSDILRTEAEKHLRHLRILGGDAERVIDKMTLNFLYLGFIALLFPRAKIIHCSREPRDIALSCYFHNFASGGLTFTFDLEHLAVVYQQHERLMAHWKKVLPIKIFEVPYEEMVANQETMTRALVDFCGMEWDDRCLAFTENKRMVKTASVLQVREPIYTKSVGRWKRYEKELEPFCRRLGC